MSASLFFFLPSSSSIWYASALLAALANVSFSASVVAMNAYLPSLAKESPEVLQVQQEILGEIEAAVDPNSQSQDAEDIHTHRRSLSDPESPEAPLIPRSPTAPVHASFSSSSKKKYDATLSRATSRISSLGIAMGYGAGIFLLIVALVPVTKLGGSTFSLRLAIGMSGIWWAVFSIPAAAWLPGANELKRSNEEQDDDGWAGPRREEEQEWNLGREIFAAWVRLGNMLRWSEVLKLRNTFKYLAAWFLLSDGTPPSLRH
jgi:UMF1 family MFS transporter